MKMYARLGSVSVKKAVSQIGHTYGVSQYSSTPFPGGVNFQIKYILKIYLGPQLPMLVANQFGNTIMLSGLTQVRCLEDQLLLLARLCYVSLVIRP